MLVLVLVLPRKLGLVLPSVVKAAILRLGFVKFILRAFDASLTAVAMACKACVVEFSVFLPKKSEEE